MACWHSQNEPPRTQRTPRTEKEKPRNTSHQFFYFCPFCPWRFIGLEILMRRRGDAAGLRRGLRQIIFLDVGIAVLIRAAANDRRVLEIAVRRRRRSRPFQRVGVPR